MEPLTTVGLPVFNGERFVQRALDAILAQDHPALEVVVCDNGSTDSTWDLVSRAAASDARVRAYRSDVNRGAAWNFNRTLELARGRYFKWAAYDDLIAPAFVSACVRRLEAGPPDIVLCYPRTNVVDDDDVVVGEFHDGMDLGEPAPHQRLSRFLRTMTECHPVFGVMRTAVLRDTRGIGPFIASDMVVLVEMLLRGRFAEEPERLFYRRFHDATSMAANPEHPDRAAWFDPSKAGRPALPAARLVRELSVSVLRTPLPRAEQARCLAVVQRHWAAPNWRVIGGEVKLAARYVRRTREATLAGQA